MNRREFLQVVGGAVFSFPGAPAPRTASQARPSFSSRAIDLVGESIVVDMLHQIVYRFDQADVLKRWLYQPGGFTQEEFDQYRRSGITVIALGRGSGPYDNALKYLAEFNGFIAAYPDRLLRIDDPSDFARAKREGKLGILLSFQDSSHFRTPDDVDLFYGLGQRASQLTYNFKNALGSGAFEPSDAGLTEFGRRIVERMNAVGMVVDVAHGGDRTILDACAASTKPVIISHGNCRALHPGYPRCVSDDAIRALAKTGGVIGINFISFMVKAKEPTTVDDVIDHIDHVRDLVGLEHVGIGSDFGLESNDHVADRDEFRRFMAAADRRYRVHAREAVQDLDHPLRFFTLTDALIRRRYTNEQIKVVTGGNFQRVLSSLWRA
jgi:membrane dipeptidase